MSAVDQSPADLLRYDHVIRLAQYWRHAGASSQPEIDEFIAACTELHGAPIPGVRYRELCHQVPQWSAMASKRIDHPLRPPKPARRHDGWATASSRSGSGRNTMVDNTSQRSDGDWLGSGELCRRYRDRGGGVTDRWPRRVLILCATTHWRPRWCGLSATYE